MSEFSTQNSSFAFQQFSIDVFLGLSTYLHVVIQTEASNSTKTWVVKFYFQKLKPGQYFVNAILKLSLSAKIKGN